MLPAVMAWRPIVTLLALAGGIALLAWQVRAHGATEILHGVASVGFAGGVAVLALSLARFYARATAWLALLSDRVPLGRAVRAVIAGDAAGNLTPLSVLVGEPAKAAYLRAPSGVRASLTALLAENYCFSVSVGLYVVLGTVVMFWRFTVQDDVRFAGALTIGFMVVVFASAAALAHWMRGWIGRYYAAAPAGLPLRARLTRVVAAEATFHIFSFLEMWLTLWFVTGQSLVAEALVLDAFGRVANVIFKVVPLQLGVLQVGSELVAQAIGLAPGVGTTVSLVRTARVMWWAVVGLGLGAGSAWRGTEGAGARSTERSSRGHGGTEPRR